MVAIWELVAVIPRRLSQRWEQWLGFDSSWLARCWISSQRSSQRTPEAMAGVTAAEAVVGEVEQLLEHTPEVTREVVTAGESFGGEPEQLLEDTPVTVAM